MAQISLTKFDLWQYRDDANCWDYVAAWLSEIKGVPLQDVPSFDVKPSDKRLMTAASIKVARSFVSVKAPENGAIAAHYHGKTLQHVGVVDGKMIRHTGYKIGTRKDSVKVFERMASKTKYHLHKSLIDGNS